MLLPPRTSSTRHSATTCRRLRRAVRPQAPGHAGAFFFEAALQRSLLQPQAKCHSYENRASARGAPDVLYCAIGSDRLADRIRQASLSLHIRSDCDVR